jgi:DNA (cytosine-5)-methyltransferase 1
LGVAQSRHRVIALAWRTSHDLEPSLPTVIGGTLEQALRGVEGASDHRPLQLSATSIPGRIARRIGPGQKLCNVRASPRAVHTWDIPEIYGKTNAWERRVLEALLRRRRQKRIRDFGDADPVAARELGAIVNGPVAATLHQLIRKGYVRRVGAYYDLVHTFNGKFRRLTWDRPAPTVDTHFGDPYYFLHPTQHRSFTIREAARIQGFPDTFAFSGPDRARFRLIGNAVPPPLARILATYISNVFLH